MAPTDLQKAILAVIAGNRSETSYLAGGLLLNRDWPRQSDDIDIFHDTDEEIGEIATRDIEALRCHGFHVAIDVFIYGCVEATVSCAGEATLIQWMSETRQRFFPLVDDPEWGMRLHQADLAVNKVLAASTRRKARDYVDLILIAEHFCALGPLVMAAAGKPPHYSPVRITDEIRHKGLSVASTDYQSVKGSPALLALTLFANSCNRPLIEPRSMSAAHRPISSGCWRSTRPGLRWKWVGIAPTRSERQRRNPKFRQVFRARTFPGERPDQRICRPVHSVPTTKEPVALGEIPRLSYLAPPCVADMQWPVDQIVLEILDIDLFFADRAAAGRDAGLVNRFRIA